LVLWVCAFGKPKTSIARLRDFLAWPALQLFFGSVDFLSGLMGFVDRSIR
jgi:hypothetical protein